MNNIKTIFSIRDLENLSGIKAHTIRIWEKRYNVLAPMRTDTNIRYYDLLNLQKLLNITLLHNHGYKISKISTFPEDKIPALVNEIISKKSVKVHAINAFKMAMMNFDQKLFFDTYNNLLSEKTLREVFYEVIIPLMEEIGLLWQTNTITPAHEHFISHLIKQKLLINTEKVQVTEPVRNDKIFVLFLPPKEVHDLGLMYVNYEIINNGYKAIYLGDSVPIESLKDVQKYFDNLVFVSYFTVEPQKEEAFEYVMKIKNELLIDDSSLWLLGKNTELLTDQELPHDISVFRSIPELLNRL